MDRKYHIVTRHSEGYYSWTSSCSGFRLFDRVSEKLINEWKEYADKNTGKDCMVIGFNRIKN